ncbi:MAG TPA: SemiSWEET transporter [Methanoregula sp.]|nr:SemiSWEET transporter [Methanoregula sp.]
MDTTVIIGSVAGTLTTASFVPQVIRSWRLRETRDISLAMLLLFAIGVILWTVYGAWIGSFPIIAANVITLALILFLLWMKIRFH